MAKIWALCVVSRNKQYETHQLDSEGQLVKIHQIYLITDWKRRLDKKHLVSQPREYGSIKSIALIFLDRM